MFFMIFGHTEFAVCPRIGVVSLSEPSPTGENNGMTSFNYRSQLRLSLVSREKPPKQSCLHLHNESSHKGIGKYSQQDGWKGKRSLRCIRCDYVLVFFLQRIRVPFIPDILKSSSSWTTFSLLGSLGSVSLTYDTQTNTQNKC